MQALQYLRKLCSHPLLVLDPAAPGHAAAVQAATGLPAATLAAWKAAQASLHQLRHAPKLLALKELLQVYNRTSGKTCKLQNPQSKKAKIAKCFTGPS